MTDQLLRFTFLLALIQGPITLALHPSTENNHILVGYAFKQFFSRDWLNCIEACHDESRCISYNYERSAGADGLCELNHCGVEELSYRDRLLIYSSGFVYQQIRRGKHCLLKSCQELKQKCPEAKSGIHTIDPLQKARPIEVFCEFDIEGGGFSFLPHSVTNRSDGKAIVDALFKDRKNVLLKLKKNVDDSQWYTLIQPHPNYADVDFGVLVNNYSGYTEPNNAFMQKYVFLGILPKSVANKKTTQGFRSNGIILEFWNCDTNPNSLFAFIPNHHHQLPYGHGGTSEFENSGIAVNWRSHAKAVTSGSLKMPNKFFFLTELHFGGCGCYTSSDRWKKFGYNATAIGIR